MLQKWHLNSQIFVDCYFLFPLSKLFTKDSDFKSPKRLDTDNRLKSCLDAISQMLEIDDCYFIGGYREKVPIPNDKPPEVRLRIYTKQQDNLDIADKYSDDF